MLKYVYLIESIVNTGLRGSKWMKLGVCGEYLHFPLLSSFYLKTKS